MRLVLLRHGRTEANERRLYCGASDLCLSAGGRAELAKLRAQVNYPKIEGLLRVSSGMRRADETMALLFGVEPEARLADFREMNFGRFELHSYEELKEDADYQSWICDGSGTVATPGGESSAEFRARVFAAANGLERDALVVCHGGTIAALMARWFPEAGKNMYQWQPGFGLGYVVELDGGKGRFYPVSPGKS